MFRIHVGLGEGGVGSRKIRKVGRPVRPARDETREWTEGALAPDVQTAFIRIARRELEHGEDERDKETRAADDPQDDGARAGDCGCGDPAQAQCRDEIEEDEVAEAERAAEAEWPSERRL